jgi:Tfp pilus assembly protein PilX
VTQHVRAGSTPEQGAAVMLALVATLLISALAGALLVMANTEALIAGNHRIETETRYAAEAALERARVDLAELPNWSDALGGIVRSSWFDSRALPLTAWNTPVDVAGMLATLRADGVAQPWGANNPAWRLFASGDLEAMTGGGAVQSAAYAAVWIADDEGEMDNNPTADSNGVVILRATAFGTSGAISAIQATVRQDSGARLLTWKVISP